ncbi:DUF547 domain-containing protein [Bizionia myxarmorum]|uniref:DUF547 domain-containing protein n=1 Tax=Bizionia myxarmorum TaxID=291186 RepID=A0A5D0R9E4_9FLAO|nr:DUF547 domain-containing protein [Bizionia myxarmorum]TYB78270.1 DUF547 domain-containing protein [Bizionia myxarmorum]
MKTTLLNKLTLFITLLALSFSTAAQTNLNKITDFNELSEQFLKDIKNGKDTENIQDKLENTTLEALIAGLKTDQEKLAFWVNIYNGYIQVILQKNPDLYKDRGEFFKKKQIAIAGEMLSFDKIEHGIIRKSQWKLGLGKVRKLFPNKFERKLRVDARDFRIHFALNCGAKNCPPVAIYSPDKLDAQFDMSSRNYLMKTTSFNEDEKTITISPLFNWFRGDFGSKNDIRAILKSYAILDSTEKISIKYGDYDWTLDLDNWTEF